MKQNPFLFVVGCPRSGTTLLQRMLDSHPQLAVVNDTHFIPKVTLDFPDETDPPLTAELIDRVRAYHRFPRLGLPEDALARAASKASTYSQLVCELYSEFASLKGKPFGGEKTPDYVRQLPRLHRLFPWAKIIHIIRDGRDVALSALEWAKDGKGPSHFELWAEEPAAVCALWWEWQVSTGRREGLVWGARVYREIKYEDLVAYPEESLRTLASFLELPFAVEMLAFHQGKTRHQPGLSAKSAWLPPTQGLRDWKTQMSARDVALFEALAGDLLATLGYERVAERFSPEIREVADRCRVWWDSEMAKREAKRKKLLAGAFVVS